MVFEGSFTTRSDWHALDCEQSLFSPSVSHARERASSVKRQRREKGGCVFSRVLFDGLRETARSLSTPGIGHLKGRAGALANHFCSETIYALNCENKTHHKVRIRSRILLEWKFYSPSSLKQLNSSYWLQTCHYTSFTTVFVDTRLWKTKHPRKRFQNSVNLACYWQIGSKSTNHNLIAWRREG